MDFLEFLMAPIIIFLVIVAPIWLILHYKSKRNASQGISEEERSQLNQMSERVEKNA